MKPDATTIKEFAAQMVESAKAGIVKATNEYPHGIIRDMAIAGFTYSAKKWEYVLNGKTVKEAELLCK